MRMKEKIIRKKREKEKEKKKDTLRKRIRICYKYACNKVVNQEQ